MILEHQVHLFPPPEPLMTFLFEWCTESCAVVQSSEFIRAKTTANQLDWPYNALPSKQQIVCCKNKRKPGGWGSCALNRVCA
jgi:hypothetical protein